MRHLAPLWDHLRHFGRGIYCNARILQFLRVMFICKLKFGQMHASLLHYSKCA